MPCELPHKCGNCNFHSSSSCLRLMEGFGRNEVVMLLYLDMLLLQNVKGSGITVFECNVDPFEKNVFHFWERYDSFQIMNDIRASPEHTKFLNDVSYFFRTLFPSY